MKSKTDYIKMTWAEARVDSRCGLVCLAVSQVLLGIAFCMLCFRVYKLQDRVEAIEGMISMEEDTVLSEEFYKEE